MKQIDKQRISNNLPLQGRSQRFKPGYSPTYVGVVFSGSGANNSSQSQTISNLDPEYIYEFNVQCKDTAGSYREFQIQLGINR